MGQALKRMMRRNLGFVPLSEKLKKVPYKPGLWYHTAMTIRQTRNDRLRLRLLKSELRSLARQVERLRWGLSHMALEMKSLGLGRKRLDLTKKGYDTTLLDLKLPTRPYNILSSDGVTTAGELMYMTMQDLLKTNNLGRKSVQQIFDALAAIGLRHPDDPRPEP